MTPTLTYPTAEEYLLSLNKIIAASGNTFTLNGQGRRQIRTVWSEVSERFMEVCQRNRSEYVFMNDVQRADWLEGFQTYLRDKRDAALQDRLDELGRGFLLCTDMVSGEPMLINKGKGRAVLPDEMGIEAFRRTYTVADWNQAIQVTPLCREVFDINTHTPIWEAPFNGESIDEDNIWYINRFTPPDYMVKTDRKDFINQLPSDVEEFFDHFVDKDPVQKHVLFSWIHNALISRNETMLILSGRGGTGKSIVVGTIMKYLIGKDYSRPAPSGFFDSAFNSILRDKRFLYHEEVGLETKRELTNVKAYLNKHITLNEKHVKSEKVSEILVSHALVCNDQNFCFMPSERKFTTPTITDKPLLGIWDAEKTTAFVDRFEEDLKFRAQVGWFFFRYDTDISPHHHGFKGEKFWELLFNSLPNISPFKAFLVEYFKNLKLGSPVTEAQVIREYNSSIGKSGNNRSGTFSQGLRNWILEFEEEGRTLCHLYTDENNRHMVGALTEGGEIPDIAVDAEEEDLEGLENL